MKKRLLLIALLLVAIGGAVYWFAHRNQEETDDATIEAHAIPMIPKVSGYVTAVNILENHPVKAGDSLITIDPRDYQIAHDHAAASLAAAEANLTNANINLKRMQDMNNLARSRKDLDDATAQAATALANEALAKAQLAQADKDLTDTQMLSPSDGIVTERGVEEGMYVQPGTTLFYLVTPDRWVTANYKETQLTHVQAGQKVDITIDAYPDLTLHGTVDSIQRGTGARFSLFPAQNATGNFVKIVQRIPVKILLNDIPTNVVLAPGMSVIPTIHTK